MLSPNGKRILQICNTASMGGASLAGLADVDRAAADGLLPHMLLPGEGPLAAEIRARGWPMHVVDHPWWVGTRSEDAWLYGLRRLPECVRRIREIIRADHVSLVVTNVSVTPAGALAACLEGFPHVWHAQEFIGAPPFDGPIDGSTLRACMVALSTHIVACSDALASTFDRTKGAASIQAAYSGIDCSSFAGCSPALDGNNIVAVGTTTRAKGVYDLVDAAIALHQAGVDFTVTVVGGFDLASDLAAVRRRLGQAGLLDRFGFAGPHADIRPFLERAAVLCCASHSEGMSRVVVEGMAAGLPVVATDCGGPRDLVVEGETGLLVPVQKPPAMAEAIRKVLLNKPLARAMGAAGRQRASERFDVTRTAAQTSAIYQQAIDLPPAVAAAPLVALFLDALAVAGPRVLLGKKWRLLGGLMR
jgi:glycosyltransferase involved in cell wall biosynthesis